MSADFAIDLGTANTLVWARRRGIVLREPTVVGVDIRTGKVIAAGQKALDAVVSARNPAQLERPLGGGAVTDFGMTTEFLRSIFARLNVSRFSRTGVLIAAPSGLTPVERDAVKDAARQAGAAKVYMIEEPMAAAIGAGLPTHDPVGSMLVDIGGGNTEAAVISLGGVVVSKETRVGGFDLDRAVQDWVRDTYDVAIGERTAEELKIAVGRAFPSPHEDIAEVQGRDLNTGLTRTIEVSSEELRIALEKPCSAIADVVVDTLGECPPELAHDVMDQGILLSGGGAGLAGMDKRIAVATGMEVRMVESPLVAVVTGAGAAIDADWDLASVYGV